MLFSYFWYLYGNFLIMYNTYYQLPISFDILKMIDRSTLYLEIVRSQETTNQYQEFKQKNQNPGF